MPVKIDGTLAGHQPHKMPQSTKKVGPSFEQVLARVTQQHKQPLRFSAHASQRLTAHGIELSDPTRQKLQTAVELARSKGIQDSLVVMDDLNFIVNIPNSSVITVVPRGGVQGDVFTQIDGAVIA